MALRFEGYVIVSADGCLTDEHHVQPVALRNKADHRFFIDGLRRADLVVHGRNSGDSDPQSITRRRVIVTHAVEALAAHPDIENAVLWNPGGASIEDAAALFDISNGTAAIIGGPAVFALFFGRYDVFWLSRAARVELPGGDGVFPGVPARTPDDILRGTGLSPSETIVLDATKDISVTAWRRSGADQTSG